MSGTLDPSPPPPKPSSRWGSILTSLICGVGVGAGALYVTHVNPALLDSLKPKPAAVPAVAQPPAVTVEDDPEEIPLVDEGLPRTSLELGILPPTEPVKTIKITLGVGVTGSPLNEPVDVHLGLGFPLRLYPLGGSERQPSFAAYPHATSLNRESGQIDPGQMASFEFSASDADVGLDELHTAPQLLTEVTCGDLVHVGFASQGRGPWILAGYRIEVNGKLFAANGTVDANPQMRLIESREALQRLMPEYQSLLEKTDLTDIEKSQLKTMHAEVRELNGRVSGSAPWLIEKLPGIPESQSVNQLRIVLTSGGDKQPGTRNPLYLHAGARKFLLTSETDPLHDEPDPQTFDIAPFDLQANPLAVESLKELGIGIIGSGGESATVPDRAKLKRVLVEADGAAVYDSEMKADDKRVLSDLWLAPVAHLDDSGSIVQNVPTPNVVSLWKSGMPGPAKVASPVPEPPVKPTAIAGTPLLRLPPPPRLLPPVRSILPTGLPRPNTLNLLPIINALANLLRPVPPPAAPLVSGVRIAPTTPIVSNGDAVTVNWTVAGNTSQITSWRITLFGVLPHLPVPLQPGALATIANSPAGAITLSGGSARVTRRMPAISVARIPAAQRPYLYVQPVVSALNARGQVLHSATGSILPLFPTGVTVANIGIGRGAVAVPRRGGHAAPLSFQVNPAAPARPLPWTPLFTADPQNVQSAWLLNSEQPAHFGQIFASHENTTTGLQPAFNTAVRPTSGGAEQVVVRFEGFVPVPPAPSPFVSLRAVAHVGFIGGSNPASTGTALARAELSAGPIQRNRAGNVSPASRFQPLFTLQTDLGQYNLTKNTAGRPQPMSLVDIPLRINRLRTNNMAGYQLGVLNAAAYTPPPPLSAANLAALNAQLATGFVYVTFTVMTTLTSPDPADAIGVFGLRLVPDTTL